MKKRVTELFENAVQRAKNQYEVAVTKEIREAAIAWSVVLTELMTLKVRVLEVLSTEQLVSTIEAASMLGVPRLKVNRMVQRGELPAVRVGGRWVIPKAEVERLFENRQGNARA